MFKLTTDHGESERLYDELSELRKKIDQLREEDERLASQKKGNPLLNKNS